MKLLNSYEAMTGTGQFFNAFLGAMLWSSTTSIDGEEFNTPMDELYTFEDIDQGTADTLLDLCIKFIILATPERLNEGNLSRAGHDFWLTIAGHGAGFWDGGLAH